MEELIFKKQGIDLYVDKTSRINHPKEIEVGNHVAIDIGVYISTAASIGDYVHIAPYTCIIGGKDSRLIMEDFSGISAGSKVLCGSDDFTQGLMNPQVPAEYRSPKITTVTFERFTCVGVNSVVMPGVTLREGSVVGANSVLTKDTEPWTIYVGSPAKPLKIRDKEVILNYAKKLGYEF
jgi:acetyltransferase-like isoleucine patch superfamily enzyme